MTTIEFANTVTNLPTEAQNEFFESVKEIFSKEDYNTIVQYISLIGLFKSPAKYKALRSAICKALFDMETPFSVKGYFEE